MFEKLRTIFQIPELRRRVLFTLGLFVVYRLGEHLPAMRDANPTVVLNVADIWWLMPRRLPAPASPANRPATVIVRMITRRGFMPA